MVLPKVIKEPEFNEPRFLLLVSAPKVGKTSNLMALPNSLLIDLENSSGYFRGMSIDVMKESKIEGVSPLRMLGQIRTAIGDEMKESGKSPYDFIILDSATILEDLAAELATITYKKTVAGKSFAGTNVVTDLPQGAGYGWLREAMTEIITPFLSLANKAVILVVHLKDKDIMKDNVSITTKDLNLTGKLKLTIPAKADGLCRMYRNDKNQNILSFKSADSEGVSFGIREPKPRLHQTEFVISEMIDGNLHTYWENVFPSISKSTNK